MTPFNRTIEISIEVDAIYEKLVSLFPEDYKHRDVLAHAMVGVALNNGGLSYIYNPMFGFTNDIDFLVGDEVICEDKAYKSYDSLVEDEHGNSTGLVREENHKPVWKERYTEIGLCKVIEINLYSPSKLKVEYHDGKKAQNSWVDHKKCTRLPKEVKRKAEAVAVKG